MAKMKALRSICNRPLELIFDSGAERIPPMKTGKFHTEAEWKGSFAEKQANEFVGRNEAKYVERDSSKVGEAEMFVKAEPQTEETKLTAKKETKTK